MEKKENKTMKKGLTIAALALLLGIVGYTGGNTFAKYVAATGHETESATVAKWGVTLTANGKLFSTDYKVTDSNTLATKDGDTLVVKAAGTSEVVAPGTTGSMTLFVTGAPDVNYEVLYDAATENNKDIYVPAKKVAEITGVEVDYYPLVWTVSNGSTSTQFNTVADVHAYLGQQLHSGKVCAANVAIGDNTTYTISWAWQFEGTYKLGDKTLTKDQVNDLDTYLGNEADLQQVAFGFDLTVEQSQEEADIKG